MTNYIKVNGEWIKNRVYAIVDAAHTRFSSTKFTATNVSDALDEIADSISGGSGGGNKITVAETAPANPSTGDMWVDTDDEETGSIPISAVSGLPSALDGKQETLPSRTAVGDILVWSGTEWVAQTPSRLPIEYQEVEYIESTGTQYIDTGIKAKDIYSVMLDVAMLGTNAQYNGTYHYEDNTVKSLTAGIREGKYMISCGGNSPNEFNLSEAAVSANRIKLGFDIGNTNLYFGTQMVKNGSKVVKRDSTVNFALFARNNTTEGIQLYCTEKMYIAIFKDAIGEYLGMFIPCFRKSDNEIGMYDLVTNTFFTNQGSGTFLKGGDI